MPGSGKSTIGAGLAAKLGRSFVDTDSIIQQTEKMVLKDIVNERGLDTFLKIQELHILNIKVKDSVIATGGSVIYSSNSINHLKKDGVIVYLKLEIDELIERLEPGRRFARSKEQSFIDLYMERLPLYDRFSDITVDCSGKDVEQLIEEIINRYQFYNKV
jgi:shikimate kinase